MKPEMIENNSVGVIERICLLSIAVIVSVFALI